MKKKLLSLLMALCLVVTLLPMSALAADAQEMTGEEFLETADEAGTISLKNDVALTSTAKITRDLEIHLNGYTLIAGDSNTLLAIHNEANVSIQGPGVVTGGQKNTTANLITVSGDANLTIQGSEAKDLTVSGFRAVNGGGDVGRTIYCEDEFGTSNVTIQNAIVSGGDFHKESAHGYDRDAGDAVYFKSNGTLTIANAEVAGGNGTAASELTGEYVSGGQTFAEGGVALYLYQGTVIIDSSVITGGDSEFYNAGDAINFGNGNGVELSITDSTVKGGGCIRPQGSYGIAGDAIEVTQNMDASSIEISGSTLQGGGGGNSWLGCGVNVKRINNDVVSLTVSDSSIAGGSKGSGSGGGYGNAIYANIGSAITFVVDLSDTTLSASEDSYDDSVIYGTGITNVALTASGSITVTDGTLKNTTITPEEGGVTIVEEAGATADVGENNLTVNSGGHVESDGQTTYYPTATEAIENAKPGSTITVDNIKEGEVLPEPPAGTTLENQTGDEIQIGGQTIPNGESLKVYVAQVGETKYTSLPEAIQAAMTGDNKKVELLTDITVDSWTQIWNIEGITLDGKNHKLTINAIESLQNHDAVFHSAGNNTFKDLTIDLSGISKPSQAQGLRAFSAAPGDTFTKVNIIGNEKVNYGITVSGTKDGASESITIENCEFTKCDYGVYSDEVTDLEKLTITGSKFTDCKYATILYTENSAFTNNMVDSGKLNIMSDKQTVTGNTFTDGSRIKFYDKPAVFEKNNISGDSKLDANTGVTGIDVSENYWGGGAPSKEQINNVTVTGNDVYYKDPSMDPEDLNTYVPSTGGGSYEPSGDYVVSVDKTVGGKVTVNPGRADKGDTVTITVKPDKGYELDSLIVTAKDGGAVKLTEKSANKFTFKMPGSKVTVEAVFVKEDTKPVVTLPFADVTTGDWFYDAVEYVYSHDLMNGTSAAAFSPYLTTSRAMMLTMLARYDGADTTTGSTWYEAGAVWAVSKGISDGTNLEADLTREQLVTMLWRYAGSPVVESGLSAYPDGAAVSDWALNAMIWATGEGVITGNGAGALNPQGTATRAEVATILMRFIEN